MKAERKPIPGQKWNLNEINKAQAPFATLIGDYQASKETPLLETMSVHFYRLDANQPDTQRPHEQDELYYVLAGSRILEIQYEKDLTRINLSQGDLVYVPANAKHTFVGEGKISLLVFFAPNFTGPGTHGNISPGK